LTGEPFPVLDPVLAPKCHRAVCFGRDDEAHEQGRLKRASSLRSRRRRRRAKNVSSRYSYYHFGRLLSGDVLRGIAVYTPIGSELAYSDILPHFQFVAATRRRFGELSISLRRFSSAGLNRMPDDSDSPVAAVLTAAIEFINSRARDYVTRGKDGYWLSESIGILIQTRTE